MSPAHVLPVAMVVLSLGAALLYLFVADWGRGAYWLSAALLTYSVTFWI